MSTSAALKVLLLAVGLDRRGEFIEEHVRQYCRSGIQPSDHGPTPTNPEALLCRYDIDCPVTSPPSPGDAIQPVRSVFLSWMRVQDLCLELFHFVLLSAQKPPTSNFISSATLEVGFLLSILEQQGGLSDVTILQLCRWLHIVVIEHEALGAAAFNEHGERILKLLPGLLSRHKQADTDVTPDIKFSTSRPLWWPGHHALLTLTASIVNVASTSDSKLTLEYCFSGMLAMTDKMSRLECWGRELSLKDYLGRGPSKTGLDVFFDLLSYQACQASAIFIITRLMHTLTQVWKDDGGGVSISNSNLTGSGSGQYPPVLAMIYNEYLHDLAVRHSHGNQAAVIQMLRGLGILLREPQYDHLTSYHQAALRRAGVFNVVGEIMEDTILKFAPSVSHNEEPIQMVRLCDRTQALPDFCTIIINQGLSLLTALISNNKVNKQAFRVSFLQQRSSLLSLSSSRDTYVAGGRECRLFQLIFHGCSASFETVRLLVDLMVDGRFPIDLIPGMKDELGDPRCNDCKAKFAVMKNREIVYVIFKLMPLLSDDVQADALRIFHSMVSGSLCELNSELRAMLMDQILDIFLMLAPEPQHASIDLMAEVGAKYLNVAQLKRVFRLLHPREESMPVYTRNVLDALQTMVTPDVGPAQFFLFDGVKSGLRLPPFANWSRKHYSFCTWLWVDRPACGGECDWRKNMRGLSDSFVTALDRYKPHIVSLLSEDGTGIEMYLTPPHQPDGRVLFEVRLEIRRGKLSQTVQWKDSNLPEFTPPQIIEGNWHFIGLSHRIGTFRSTAEVLLVINSDVYRGSLNYPSLRLLSSNSFIGNRTSNKAHRNADEMYQQVNYCLKGKMASMYFFDDALTENQFRSIKSKGPNYSFSFEPSGFGGEADGGARGDDSGGVMPTDDGRRSPSSVSSKDSFQGTVDGFLVSKIILLFHPGSYRNWVSSLESPVGCDIEEQVSRSDAVNGRGEEDTGPYFDRKKRKIFVLLRASANMNSRTHAMLMPGSYANNCKDVRDALDCLGGIKVLYPLFKQFELPVMKHTGELDFTVDTDLCVKILDLLGKLMYYSATSTSNRRFLQESNPFFFISYLLERLSPKHTSSDLVDAIMRLITQWLRWSQLMADQATLHLLGNFKIWVFADPDIQIKAFRSLRTLIAGHPNRLRKVLGVHKMIDALTFFFSYEQDGHHTSSPSISLLRQLSASENTSHHRPRGADLVAVRREVLCITLDMIGDNYEVSTSETELLLGYLANTVHPRGLSEVLNLLLHVLGTENKTVSGHGG